MLEETSCHSSVQSTAGDARPLHVGLVPQLSAHTAWRACAEGQRRRGSWGPHDGRMLTLPQTRLEWRLARDARASSIDAEYT